MAKINLSFLLLTALLSSFSQFEVFAQQNGKQMAPGMGYSGQMKDGKDHRLTEEYLLPKEYSDSYLLEVLKKFRKKISVHSKKSAKGTETAAEKQDFINEKESFVSWLEQLKFSDLEFIYRNVIAKSEKLEFSIYKLNQKKDSKKSFSMGTKKAKNHRQLWEGLQREKKIRKKEALNEAKKLTLIKAQRNSLAVEKLILYKIQKLYFKDSVQLANTYLNDALKNGISMFDNYKFRADFNEYEYEINDFNKVKLIYNATIFPMEYGINGIGEITVKMHKSDGDWVIGEVYRNYVSKPVNMSKEEYYARIEAQRERKKNLHNIVVENILNKSDAFRSAKLIRTWTKDSREQPYDTETIKRNMGILTNYDYEVEYVTRSGHIRIGTMTVVINDGKCIEVFWDGKELWTQIMDPKLEGYRNP